MTCLAAPEKPLSCRSLKPPVPGPAGLWGQIEMTISLTLSVRLIELRAPTRCRVEVAFARQVAMYVAHAAFGMRYTAIGRLCGRDHTTVAYACRVIEQRRDDPDFDRMLQLLEALCRDMASDVPEMLQVRT